MMLLTKKDKLIIISAVIIIIVMFVVYGVVKNSITSQTIAIDFKNINSVIIKQSDGDKEKIVKKIKGNDTDVTLKKYSDYVFEYTANDGYENGIEELYVDESTENLSIYPGYTQEKLTELLTKENIDIINQAILSSNPYIGEYYTINTGNLYDDGSWYGAVLTYKGTDYYNTDNLKIILKKEDGQWKVVASPSILFNKFDYPNIPIKVLEKVNRL